MADRRDAHRRASIYRQRARELAVAAEQERGRRFEGRRQHLLDQAAAFRLAADQMEPPKPVGPPWANNMTGPIRLAWPAY